MILNTGTPGSRGGIDKSPSRIFKFINMGNIKGNTRRGDLNYRYDVFNEIRVPRSSDRGERLNILLTEISRISNVLKLTVSFEDDESYIYFGSDKLKAILGHTRYKIEIDYLIREGILSWHDRVNHFGDSVYSFEPIFYTPISRGVQVRNLKVRNGVRRYLGIHNEKISPEVFKWIRPSLIKTEIRISEADFYSGIEEKYERYRLSKTYKGERFRSLENYRKDLNLTFYSIKQYQQFDKYRRSSYVREDKFSGRIYNIATGVPRWVRSYIFLDNEPVVEIDMKSSHAVLLWNIVPRTDWVRFLYELTSRDCDIYQGYGDLLGINDRREVKFRFLRSLYSRPNSKFSQEFSRLFPEAGEILDEIKRTDNPRNPSNGKGTHTNLAFKLLNMEVRLFKKVWEAFSLEEIPFLSIHDGILVPASKVTRARALMTEILRHEIPIIETKTIYY